MLKIFDKSHSPIGYVHKYKDLKRESVLETADKTLSFTCLQADADLDYECYIQDKTDEYVIKEVRQSSDGYPQITAVLNTEELDGKTWESFVAKDSTIREAANLALAGTGWRVDVCEITKHRNVGIKKTNSREILQKLCIAFLCEMVLDSKAKTVSFYEHTGQDRGVYFIPSLNLKKVSVTGDTYDYYTRIVPIGKDGLKITEVNGGKDYLENYQYSNKVLTYIWEDTSYEDAQALKEDAGKKLEDLSKPKKSYSATVRDLAAQNETYDILSYSLGDTVTLIDQSASIRDKQRIVKLTEYPQDPNKNTCELANTRPSFEELQQKLREAASLAEAAINSDGSLNGKITIGQILGWEEGVETGIAGSETIKQISGDVVNVTKELNVVKATVGSLDATYLKVTEAEIKYATIENLNATNAEVHSIEGEYAEFKTATMGELEANKAEIKELSGDYAAFKVGEFVTLKAKQAEFETATVRDLTAQTGRIDTLTGDLADYKKVVAGELEANKADIKELSGDYAAFKAGEFETLKAKQSEFEAATVKDLEAQTGRIDTLTGDLADYKKVVTGELEAVQGTFESLDTKFASVDLANIEDGCITTAMIGQGVVGNAQIADGSITDAKIVDLTANKITAGTIDAAEIEVINLKADNITVGKINGKQIDQETITSENLAPEAVKTEHIGKGVITAEQIKNGEITGEKIALGAVTANRLNLSTHILM